MPFPANEIPFLSWAQTHEWEEQKGSAKRWSFADHCLRLTSNDTSTTVGTAKGFPIPVDEATTLQFDALVSEAPTGADLSQRAKEDAALRIFVLFDQGGGIISPPQTLGYAFMPDSEIDTMVTSDWFDNVKYITVGNTLGKRLAITGRIQEDYQRAFGSADVPAIQAIGVKADSNHTGQSSRAVLCRLEIEDEAT
jgi:hypothetical protein